MVTTSANAANSRRLHFLLMVKLKGSAMEPFLNNPEYDAKGFEMVARLCQTYAPSAKSDLYSNFFSLFYLEMGPQESVEQLFGNIRRYDLLLKAADITLERRRLSMIGMKALDDRFEALKNDFILNPETYSTLSLDHLEQRILQWRASASTMSSASPTALPTPAYAAAAGAHVKPSSHSSNSHSSTSILSIDDVKQLRTDGNCVCGCKHHTLASCDIFVQAGYLIEYHVGKAKEKWDAVLAKRSKGRASRDDSAAPASPPPSASASVGVAASASISAAAAVQTASYPAIDSDDDDDIFERDVGVGIV